MRAVIADKGCWESHLMALKQKEMDNRSRATDRQNLDGSSLSPDITQIHHRQQYDDTIV